MLNITIRLFEKKEALWGWWFYLLCLLLMDRMGLGFFVSMCVWRWPGSVVFKDDAKVGGMWPGYSERSGKAPQAGWETIKWCFDESLQIDVKAFFFLSVFWKTEKIIWPSVLAGFFSGFSSGVVQCIIRQAFAFSQGCSSPWDNAASSRAFVRQCEIHHH